LGPVDHRRKPPCGFKKMKKGKDEKVTIIKEKVGG